MREDVLWFGPFIWLERRVFEGLHAFTELRLEENEILEHQLTVFLQIFFSLLASCLRFILSNSAIDQRLKIYFFKNVVEVLLIELLLFQIIVAFDIKSVLEHVLFRVLIFLGEFIVVFFVVGVQLLWRQLLLLNY